MSGESGIDVGQLVSAGDGEHLELKAGLADARTAARAISGLANSGGGQLVVGVGERGQDSVGLHDPTAVEQTLDAAAKLVTPGVDLRVQRVTQGTHSVIIADVGSSKDRPVAGPEGEFVRRGPSGNSIPLSAPELKKVAEAAANPSDEILRLLVVANDRVVHLQATLDQERADAAAERKEAKRSRSLKMRILDWTVAGVIGALLGGVVTVLLS